MTSPKLPPAKAVLLAVDLVRKADLSTFRTLVSRNRKTLQNDIVLRIILSYLPETLESSKYVPFLHELISDQISEDSNSLINQFTLDEISNAEANKQVRKLHLLPLRWAGAPAEMPEDSFDTFLIHRSLRVDATGSTTELPSLLAPFLNRSTYLRIWTISTVLPLLRLNYEYHRHDGAVLSIPAFQKLDNQSGVALLLSKTGKDVKSEDSSDKTVGRDLRGLIGPWMYGDWKRRKRQARTNSDAQTIEPLDELQAHTRENSGWDEVFDWITEQAASSWNTAVEAIEQWDGPRDVDLGGYGDGVISLNEDDQQHLERRYARAALAAAYLVPEASVEALTGVYRILTQIITLLDLDRIPTLSAAAALLSPVSGLGDGGILSIENAMYLRNDLLDERNILTSPKEPSIQFLHILILSAYLLTRAGIKCTIRRVGELVLRKQKREQDGEFLKLILAIRNGPKEDDKYWIRTRNEILWLHSWGAEELTEGADTIQGKGIFGKVDREFMEAELLKLLLANTRYNLARSIYEASAERPISQKLLHDTVISAAINAYDKATNANRTRGGIMKCDEILHAFPDTLSDSFDKKQLDTLIALTHSMGEYRLVIKSGVPFTPVILRTHIDPISIIGKILDQNRKSYTRIDEFLFMGRQMVEAGLTVRQGREKVVMTEHQLQSETSTAEKRVLSMCVDAALAEDDFETAYSYVVTRLSIIGLPANSRTPELEGGSSGLFARPLPKTVDDWSWRAALQAGKYRRNAQTVKPTHLGNATGNIEIRHLNQRMECLSLALRLAPKSTLMGILNVFRRCEEELESQTRHEAEQEAAWDAKGDGQSMPGGFSATPERKINASNRMIPNVEDAPMSLFDLSRASVSRAQSGLASLAMLRKNSIRTDLESRTSPAPGTSSDNSRTSTPDSGLTMAAPRTARRRDQFRNAAVGIMASGIGALLGAEPVTNTQGDEEDE